MNIQVKEDLYGIVSAESPDICPCIDCLCTPVCRYKKDYHRIVNDCVLVRRYVLRFRKVIDSGGASYQQRRTTIDITLGRSPVYDTT